MYTIQYARCFISAFFVIVFTICMYCTCIIHAIVIHTIFYEYRYMCQGGDTELSTVCWRWLNSQKVAKWRSDTKALLCVCMQLTRHVSSYSCKGIPSLIQLRPNNTNIIHISKNCKQKIESNTSNKKKNIFLNADI